MIAISQRTGYYHPEKDEFWHQEKKGRVMNKIGLGMFGLMMLFVFSVSAQESEQRDDGNSGMSVEPELALDVSGPTYSLMGDGTGRG